MDCFANGYIEYQTSGYLKKKGQVTFLGFVITDLLKSILSFAFPYHERVNIVRYFICLY